MSFSFATPAREVLEQVNRQPRFREITTIPTFAPQTIGLIAFAYGFFALNTVAYVLGYLHWAIMIPLNGVAIFAAFTPLHDATHRTVSSNRPFNDFLGTLACFMLLPGITTRIYRYLHLEHHRFSGDKHKDPDEPFVSAGPLLLPFVIAFPDLLWTLWYLRHWTSRPLSERVEFALCISFYVAFHVAWLTSPYALEFVLAWMIPQRIGASLVTYFFARIQHPEHVLWVEAPFQCTVQVVTNPFLEFMMLGQTIHVVHHLFPSVPFYRYHKAWNAGLSLFEAQNIPTRKFFTPSRDMILPNKGTPAWVNTKVASVCDVADGIRSYKLRSVDGKGLPPFDAGSHIDVLIEDGLVRQYSMCNSPNEKDCYLLAIKEEIEGRGGSHRIHATVEAGQNLEVSLPRNNFPLRKPEATEYVMVAGGIGLTPLLSMAHLLHERGANFTLHIGARNRAALPFGNELGELPFADRIQIYLDDGSTDQRLIPGVSAGIWRPGKQLYICGPSGFMTWYVDATKDAGWPDEAIYSETFVPRQLDKVENKRFQVKLARSGKVLTVEPDEFLLDVLNANNCGVICSCTQGICGSCITNVLEGVPEHRDAIMSDDERNTNKKMCVCVSRAKSDLLVLDL